MNSRQLSLSPFSRAEPGQQALSPVFFLRFFPPPSSQESQPSFLGWLGAVDYQRFFQSQLLQLALLCLAPWFPPECCAPCQLHPERAVRQARQRPALQQVPGAQAGLERQLPPGFHRRQQSRLQKIVFHCPARATLAGPPRHPAAAVWEAEPHPRHFLPVQAGPEPRPHLSVQELLQAAPLVASLRHQGPLGRRRYGRKFASLWGWQLQVAGLLLVVQLEPLQVFQVPRQPEHLACPIGLSSRA